MLAITAAKLGFGPVTALDNDPVAVAATAENAAINGVRSRLAATTFAPSGAARAVVAANLLARC